MRRDCILRIDEPFKIREIRVCLLILFILCAYICNQYGCRQMQHAQLLLTEKAEAVTWRWLLSDRTNCYATYQ